MDDWRLNEAEWENLRDLLGSREAGPRPGRPRSGDEQRIAEACLYRHFHAQAGCYRSFGWNKLPKEFAVAPSTANRRFREWTESGAWERFWDALVRLRHPERGVPARVHPNVERGSPVRALIGEFERAYHFFNARFFAGALRPEVVIAVERPPRRRGDARRQLLGYFCEQEWHRGDEKFGHLAICTTALGQGAAIALGVLLHEMVHLRNHQVGLDDCDPKTGYHNRHFRDVALLAGLLVAERDPGLGYGQTRLAERGAQAIRELCPDEGLFEWVVESKETPVGRMQALQD